jgi:hypothetical protein
MPPMRWGIGARADRARAEFQGRRMVCKRLCGEGQFIFDRFRDGGSEIRREIRREIWRKAGDEGQDGCLQQRKRLRAQFFYGCSGCDTRRQKRITTSGAGLQQMRVDVPEAASQVGATIREQQP